MGQANGVYAVIPARWSSSRFAGKPLAFIAGKPMIQWVYERTRQVEKLDQVIVATDDERIYKKWKK
jgi:3-deoxy-manno-octulosonate cytidylyltransferase (CMP-KDO synthetase)